MTIPTIVVGVDGNPASHSALSSAMSEATLRRGRVVVVVSWSAQKHHLPTTPGSHDGDSFAKAQKIADDAIAAVVSDADRAMVVTSISEGEPGDCLVHGSRDADLLVIGSTTRGAVARHAGKTVVDHCLRHSDIPVLVVPYLPVGLQAADIEAELLSTYGDERTDIPVRLDRTAR